jgi:serine/threonine protein phosphatase 1
MAVPALIDIAALAPETESTVVYAIGDIHGRLDLLLRLEAQIAADVAGRPGAAPLIIYLGDYVDRGPASAGVIGHLAGDHADGVRRVFLLGNHEERMLAFLMFPARDGPRWLQYGGREALQSYGISDADLDAGDWPRLRDLFAAALPPRHLDFLRGLSLAARWRDYLFVHAGLNPERDLSAQDPDDLIWIREPFLTSDRDWGVTVVHGHVIGLEPVFRANRIGLDTGAYASGVLTCAVIDVDEVGVLQTG